MARKKIVIEGPVDVVDTTADGRGIAKHDGRVIFVRGAIPGDRAELKITGRRRRFLEAMVDKLEKPSEYRIEPVCDHFGICGGCKWQHFDYEGQLKYKSKMVTDSLNRIGKVELPESEPILGAKELFRYRNKMDYSFCKSRWLSYEEMDKKPELKTMPGAGLHAPNIYYKVVHVDNCHLQHEFGDEIRNALYNFAVSQGLSFYDQQENAGLLRGLILRNSSIGQWMAVAVFGEKNKEHIVLCMDYLKDKFPQINSLNYIINTKLNDSIYDLKVVTFEGEEAIYEQFENLKFKISPKSFFQTNSAQGLELYKVVRDYANLQGTETVYDLYTGTGSIAIFLAEKAHKVVGIESVPDAIGDAKLNAKLNGIQNADFVCGQMRDAFSDEFIKKHGRADLVVLDPPRAGMHKDVIAQLRQLSAARVIYVSCNPATQARDLAELADLYRVVRYRPVDLFPHTAHVENVVELILR